VGAGAGGRCVRGGDCGSGVPRDAVRRGATGFDVLNGTEQRLKVARVDGKMALKGMLIEDYPVVLRLSVVKRLC